MLSNRLWITDDREWLDTMEANRPAKFGEMVRPAVLYQPHMMATTWFQTWAIKCGFCGKDFVRWAWFGKPRCPYCRVRNVPDLTIYP